MRTDESSQGSVILLDERENKIKAPGEKKQLPNCAPTGKRRAQCGIWKKTLKKTTILAQKELKVQ